MTEKETEYTLAIISNYPIEGYYKIGYDNLYSYYNPLGFFKKVHFFEPPLEYVKFSPKANNILLNFTPKAKTKRIETMGREHTFYIHRTVKYDEMKQVFAKNKIDCIRIFEMYSFDLAKKIAAEFNVPLVVGIH